MRLQTKAIRFLNKKPVDSTPIISISNLLPILFLFLIASYF